MQDTNSTPTIKRNSLHPDRVRTLALLTQALVQTDTRTGRKCLDVVREEIEELGGNDPKFLPLADLTDVPAHWISERYTHLRQAGLVGGY